MGNSQTKEARGSPSSSGGRASTSTAPSGRGEAQQSPTDIPPRPPYATRPRRSSRPDLSFLGIGGNSDQDATSLEARRESKQDREARKSEKERVTRLKEREQSMKEEHVDGGYLVTQGVYVGVEDYNKVIVRQLMIERRLAPFWKGLNDFSESWAEHQLMAAARGLLIPPADEVPPELEYRLTKRLSPDSSSTNDKSTKSLMIPINSRSHSYQSDTTPQHSPAFGSFPLQSPSSQITSTSPLFRTRAKTLASLTTSPRSGSPAEMLPREFQLPTDPFVNGQPIEAYLYKDSSECPICFLYYPPYLNTTRCCDQAICSECFVQIKRPEPHQPEHEQPDANAPALSEEEREAQAEGLLISEVATCPYCKQAEFGISYVPPPFRRGLTYGAGSQQPYQIRSAVSSQTSISSSGLSPGPGRRRGTSLSANAPEVITTDKIRPDWATKLATARAHAARRSAAATALHTAAYLMNGQADTRMFGPFGRRARRPTLEGLDPSMNSHLSALAMLAERHTPRQQEMGTAILENRGNPFLPPARGSSSRRNRMDDLEDMMMMEAIRLSLASEEDRRKKEDKEAKKEAKKKDKEAKKFEKSAEKSARKNSLFTLNSNTSNFDGTPMERTQSGSSSIGGDDASAITKGKAVDRANYSPSSTVAPGEDGTVRPSSIPSASLFSTSQESLASSSFPPLASEPFKRSHLRQMSNVSSSASSFIDSGAGQVFAGSCTPPGGGAGLEPMFNFRSLAAMIGDEEQPGGSLLVEDSEEPGRGRSFEEIDDKAGSDQIPSSPDSASSGHQQSGEQINGSATHSGDVKRAIPVISDLSSESSAPAI